MNITNYGDGGPRMLQTGDPGSSAVRPGDIIADRELYLASDDRVVERRDPDRLFLLIAPGQVLTREKAAEHSLRAEDGKITWGEAKAKPEANPEVPAKKAEPKAATKAVAAETKKAA